MTIPKDQVKKVRQQFIQWVQEEAATLDTIAPWGIKAWAGCFGRSYEPEGGLTMEDWPDLQTIFGEGNEITELNKQELLAAIEKNEKSKQEQPKLKCITTQCIQPIITESIRKKLQQRIQDKFYGFREE